MKLAKRPDIRARESERTCIVTGAVGAPAEMVRFALDPEGVVTPDLAGKLPGRGAWVCASREAAVRAAQNNLFRRAFKTSARFSAGCSPAAFAEEIALGLRRRALSALGLARRAGAAAAGFENARDMMTKGAAAVLVSAREAAKDGVSKLARLSGDIPHVRGFAGGELEQAVGQPGVTHVALRQGPESDRFLREVARLDGFDGMFEPRRETESAAI